MDPTTVTACCYTAMNRQSAPNVMASGNLAGIDNFDFIFSHQVFAAGLWIGNISPGTTEVQFLGPDNAILASEVMGYTHPGILSGGGATWDNRLFYGLISDTPIARIRTVEPCCDSDGVVYDDVTFTATGTPPPCLSGQISWWRAEGNANDSIGNNHGALSAAQILAIYRAGSVSLCNPCVETTFSDSTFNSADWDVTLFPTGNGGSVAAFQQTSGGNPGAYRRVINTVNTGNPSSIFSFHRRIGMTYDPRILGAIETVDHAEDAFVFSGFGAGQASGPALRQNGKVFIWQRLLTGVPATWTRFAQYGLRQEDFIELVGGASQFDFNSHPDFSGTATPFEVGFYRANSTAGAGYTIDAGIDNWSITFRRCTLNGPPSVVCPARMRPRSVMPLVALRLRSPLRSQTRTATD